MKKPTRVAKRLKQIKAGLGKGGTVDVGILRGHYPDGTSIALVAFWNEFGTRKAPERPFIRSTLFAHKNYKDTLEKIGRSIVAGKYNQKQGLTILGQIVKQDIQKTIVELRSPPNSPTTIAAKGSSNPLIDTGLMKSSIDFNVRLKNEK